MDSSRTSWTSTVARQLAWIEYCSDKDRVEQTVTVPVDAVLCAVQFSCECCRVYVKRIVQSVMCSVQFLVM